MQSARVAPAARRERRADALAGTRPIMVAPRGRMRSEDVLAPAPQAVPHPAAQRRLLGPLLFWAALAALLVVHLAWLVRFPGPFVDEPQNVNWLLTWWDGTWATDSMDRIAFPA